MQISNIYLHLALDMLCGKSAFGKSRTHLILGISWEFFPDLLQACILTRLDLLFKISDVQIVSKLRLAAILMCQVQMNER